MTCWAGERLFDRSAPMHASRTRSWKPLTTVKLTSASSRASRISFRTSSTSSSVSRPLPRRRVKMPSKRSERLSNMRSTTLPVHRSATDALDGLEDLHRDGEDDRRVLLGGDLHHRLQLAKL